MTLNSYDIEDGLSLDKRHPEIENDDDENDIDIYGNAIKSKKNRIKEIIKKNVCAVIGVGCFAVFTITSMFLIFSHLERSHVDQTNQILDFIDAVNPIAPAPDLFIAPTPTLYIPTMPSIMPPLHFDNNLLGRVPRRRRY